MQEHPFPQPCAQQKKTTDQQDQTIPQFVPFPVPTPFYQHLNMNLKEIRTRPTSWALTTVDN
jgi:hypothetical protein